MKGRTRPAVRTVVVCACVLLHMLFPRCLRMLVLTPRDLWPRQGRQQQAEQVGVQDTGQQDAAHS